MNEIKKVLLCGLGAVGMAVADKIKRCAEIELKILVDETRLERYKQFPRIYNGKQTDFDYILPSCNNFAPDLIIIAVKFGALQEVIGNLEPFVRENTVLLPVLNGIRADEILLCKFGADKVLSGFYIGHSAIRSGENITNDGIFKLVFGSNAVASTKINAVKSLFDACGQDYDAPDDINFAKWCKFALNIVCNQPSAVLRFDFGEMKRNKAYHALAHNMLKEVIKIARAEGVKNAENIEKYAMNALLNLMDNGKTSMLQDIEQGRRTEVDIFAGEIVKLGEKYGIPTPYSRVFLDLLRTIESSMQA